MKHGSLFSGIGGFDLAAEWMGWENVFHCEWNPFGQKVLKYYWPNAISYDDITKTDFTVHRGNIDILTGGFPCQPYSMAGKRKGKEDERHLFPEMLRAIREIEPRWIVGENVYGLVNWSGGLVFHEVQSDLEAAGYEVQPFLLPAAGVNAPHRRDRIWFVAYSSSNRKAQNRCCNPNERTRTSFIQKKDKRWQSETVQPIGLRNMEWDAANTNSNGLNECNGEYEVNTSEARQYAQRDTQQSINDGNAADTNSNRLEGCLSSNINKQISSKKEYDAECLPTPKFRLQFKNFPTVSPICIGDDGLSDRLDGITFSKWRNESIKAGGNAVVPQVVYQIFKTIEQYEKTKT